MDSEPVVVVAPEVNEPPAFDTPNILWFFGAFTAAAASEGVIAEVDPTARGVWIMVVSLAFLAAFALLSRVALRAGWWVPGGVLAAMAVTFVVPAAIAFERLIGVWEIDDPFAAINPVQEFEWTVVAVVAALAAAGLIAFKLVQFHFILAIVAFATFVLAQLLAPIVASNMSPSDHATAVGLAGVGLIAIGLGLDLATDRRTAFWWHFVGLLALTVGLAYHAFEQSDWGWVIILVAGTIVLLLGASLRRATWGVFGVAGVYAPIANYLDDWFGNLGLSFALAVLGLGLVALGIGARIYGDAIPAFRRRPPATPEAV